MKRIELVDYDSKYPAVFNKEKDKLCNILPRCDIFHIGSTAVLGLGGKGFIDILVLSTDKKSALAAINVLESKGYELREHAGDRYRFFLRKKAKNRFHIHLMWRTNSRYKDLILFRDYLINSPKAAKEYFEMKKIWIKKAKGIRQDYTSMKPGYIQSVLRKLR